MRIDSPIISAGIKLTNLLILNLYWVIGCLPVITIGTSTIAAFSVTLKMTEDREGASMTVQFWKAYVKNLKHGIPLSLILLAGCGSILLDVRMIEARAGDAMGLLTAGIILILLLLLHFIYVFPLEARYQNGLLAEFLLVTQFNTPLRTFSILFLPILMIYTISKAVMPVFRKLEDKDGKK